MSDYVSVSNLQIATSRPLHQQSLTFVMTRRNSNWSLSPRLPKSELGAPLDTRLKASACPREAHAEAIAVVAVAVVAEEAP